MEKILHVQEELQRMERGTAESKKLIEQAKARLADAETFWKNDDFRQAYAEADRSLRPLRIMMRAQWELAVRRLDTPVSSPYAVSLYTLPRHWQFVNQITTALANQPSAGTNVLPDGDFEIVPSRLPRPGVRKKRISTTWNDRTRSRTTRRKASNARSSKSV